MYDTLQEVIDNYEPTAAFQKELCEEWYNRVNQVPQLKALRDFVEENQFGHGERPFYWLFKILVDEMPDIFTFFEIGVYRGQTITLMCLLKDMAHKSGKVVGVTPLDSTDNHIESDYEKDILHIYNLVAPKTYFDIIKGLSNDADIINQVKTEVGLIDLLYIDGGHSFEVVTSDILNYIPLVKVGGFILMDDCCNGWDLPQGYFSGIQSVTDAVDSLLPPVTERDDVEFLFNCGHIRVYRKIK